MRLGALAQMVMRGANRKKNSPVSAASTRARPLAHRGRRAGRKRRARQAGPPDDAIIRSKRNREYESRYQKAAWPHFRAKMGETGVDLVAVAPGSHMDWMLGFHPAS